MDFSAAATRLKTSREKFDLGQAAQTNAYAPEALRLYQESASDGYAPAQRQLAELYATGQLVSKDDKQALHWYRLAGQQGRRNNLHLGHFAQNTYQGESSTIFLKLS